MLTLLTCVFVLDHVTVNLVTSAADNDVFSPLFAAGLLGAVDPLLGNSCLRTCIGSREVASESPGFGSWPRCFLALWSGCFATSPWGPAALPVRWGWYMPSHRIVLTQTPLAAVHRSPVSWLMQNRGVLTQVAGKPGVQLTLGATRFQFQQCLVGLSLSLCQQCLSLLDFLLGCDGKMTTGSAKLITYQLSHPAKRDNASSRKIREVPGWSLSSWLGTLSVHVLYTMARGSFLGLQWPEEGFPEEKEGLTRRVWGHLHSVRGNTRGSLGGGRTELM